MNSSLKLRLTWQNIERYCELLYVLVERNLKVRYRGSFLGIYWSLLNPLIMTAVYTTIFGKEFSSYYNNSIVSYMLSAFIGLVVINFFSASTSQALVSITINSSLMNKICLPISIFPISTIVANIFHLAISVIPLLLIITLFYSNSFINIFALFLPLLALTLVCTGIGLIVSTMYVFFRDVSYFYELLVSFLLFGSPIFYPFQIVPAQVKPILFFNPLVAILESLRQISLSNESPNLYLLSTSLLSGIFFLIFGWLCFQNWRNNFMDLL